MANTASPQSEQEKLVSTALKHPAVGRVMDAYGQIAPYVPVPSSPPAVKSQVSAGGNGS
jgi:hypothetical protein